MDVPPLPVRDSVGELPAGSNAGEDAEQAGETSTAVCSIAFAAAAAAAHIPGGHLLLVVMIGFNVISTVVTARTPGGDYAKAIRAPRAEQ